MNLSYMERVTGLSLERYIAERDLASLDAVSNDEAFQIVMDYMDECERRFRVLMLEDRLTTTAIVPYLLGEFPS